MVPPEPPGPTPIPVEGDVQIFADPECTTYADGTQSTVYVRVNNPWTEEWTVDVDFGFHNFTAFTNPWACNVWVDWVGVNEQDTPFVAGQIVECFYGDPYTEPQDVQMVFIRP